MCWHAIVVERHRMRFKLVRRQHVLLSGRIHAQTTILIVTWSRSVHLNSIFTQLRLKEILPTVLKNLLRWQLVSKTCCRRRFIRLSWRHSCHHRGSWSIAFGGRAVLSATIDGLDSTLFVALVTFSLAALSARGCRFTHSDLISFLHTEERLILHLRLIKILRQSVDIFWSF